MSRCGSRTGADDRLVCVYELRGGPGGRTFGSSDVANVENWKHTMTLKGHSNNVLDLAWAPEDQWIATCSVDNQARLPHTPPDKPCAGRSLNIIRVPNRCFHKLRIWHPQTRKTPRPWDSKFRTMSAILLGAEKYACNVHPQTLFPVKLDGLFGGVTRCISTRRCAFSVLRQLP